MLFSLVLPSEYQDSRVMHQSYIVGGSKTSDISQDDVREDRFSCDFSV
jgi:hypothetical protein